MRTLSKNDLTNGFYRTRVESCKHFPKITYGSLSGKRYNTHHTINVVIGGIVQRLNLNLQNDINFLQIRSLQYDFIYATLASTAYGKH
jgi:hypothetical protein